MPRYEIIGEAQSETTTQLSRSMAKLAAYGMQSKIILLMAAAHVIGVLPDYGCPEKLCNGVEERIHLY